ncbi:RNA polymerase factor sigma-32 [Desulfovibrio desulfuricans]|uniref:RNA polymerase factor sigma-32 n=1 Tax=Desulfovibrio desulfuricans TaxID=876 RepID=UPI001C02889B|nr:RNA polymerase factor sigma-32 [Desulfovibrio desulfuricans]MBT9749425.1 sigma-70 family RNA polymerase sigma factor [Desulfovibrio desulfuricans]
MKKDSPIAPKNPRSAQKAEETEISSPEVEILDAPPSRKRAAPAGGGTRGGAAKARSRSTEGKATKQSILDVDGSAVREVPADSVSDDQDDDDALADSAEDVDVELDASDHGLDPLVLDDDHEGLPAPSTTRLPAVGPRDSLHLYLREVSRFPLLKPDEEHELALRVRDHNDADAAFRLVSSHLRLVVRIAMDFQRRWMQNVLDLVQEGNVGLMRAVNKFDPDKGIKFSYYASFWIKAYILKFIMDNWRMVKIGTTQVQRKLFYNLNRERQKLIMQGFDPDAAMLSERLGVTEDQINEMDQRLASTDMSLNVPVGEDAGGATRMDFLPALGPGIEDSLASDEIAGLVRSKLKTILPKLNEKELYILQNRLLTDEPVTLREIGERYNVTRERVRQLEARLLEKIRQHLAVDIKDFSDTWIQS